jgi:hypothetical protein
MAAMDVQKDITLPADPAAVLRLWLDPAFHERRCEAAHAVRYEVNVEPAGATTAPATVATSRALPTDRLPDLVRSFVGQTLTLVERIDWTDAASAAVHVRVEGAPITLTGAYALGPGPEGGSRLAVRAEVKATVPIIGRRIEQMVLPVMQSALEADERLAREALSAR